MKPCGSGILATVGSSCTWPGSEGGAKSDAPCPPTSGWFQLWKNETPVFHGCAIVSSDLTGRLISAASPSRGVCVCPHFLTRLSSTMPPVQTCGEGGGTTLFPNSLECWLSSTSSAPQSAKSHSSRVSTSPATPDFCTPGAGDSPGQAVGQDSPVYLNTSM